MGCDQSTANEYAPSYACTRRILGIAQSMAPTGGVDTRSVGHTDKRQQLNRYMQRVGELTRRLDRATAGHFSPLRLSNARSMSVEGLQCIMHSAPGVSVVSMSTSAGVIEACRSYMHACDDGDSETSDDGCVRYVACTPIECADVGVRGRHEWSGRSKKAMLHSTCAQSATWQRPMPHRGRSCCSSSPY